MGKRQPWPDFLRQVDEKLARVERQLHGQNLAPVRESIRTLCTQVTRSNSTNQARELLNEPGKVLLPDWNAKVEVVQTLVFDCLAIEGFLTRTQADDLHTVFAELVRLLREGTTPYKRSQIAADAVMAIKCYLSERGGRKRRGPPSEHDPAMDEKLVVEWKRAKAAGITREGFCKSQRISLKQLTAAQSRLRWHKGKKPDAE
jgi:hypothetical protein